MASAREIQSPDEQHPADPEDHQRHVPDLLGQAAPGQAASWSRPGPYFQALRRRRSSVSSARAGHVESRYLYPDEEPSSAERHLWLSGHHGRQGPGGSLQPERAEGGPAPAAGAPGQTKLFVVGEYGRQYFQQPSDSHRAELSLYRARTPPCSGPGRSLPDAAGSVSTGANCRKSLSFTRT